MKKLEFIERTETPRASVYMKVTEAQIYNGTIVGFDVLWITVAEDDTWRIVVEKSKQ